MLNRYDEALATADALLKIATALGDKLAESNALDNKGNSLRMLNRYDEALAAAERSPKIATALGDKRTEAIALNNQGNSLRMLNRYEEALAAATASHEAARAAKSKLAQAYALQSQILCQAELGMADEREESLRQLRIIDPGLAERLETYPVRPRRDDAEPTLPSFGGMLQEIFKKTKADERRMREVLHSKATTPEALPGDLQEYSYVSGIGRHTRVSN